MNRSWFALALILAAATSTESIFAASKVPQAISKLEKKYSAAQTLSLQFEQIRVSQITKQREKSTGKIYFSRPNRIRWETETPEKSLLVSDGKTFWFYTPPFSPGDAGQVAERRSQDVQSQFAQDLLSGSLSVAKDTRIEDLGSNRFRLTPKKGSAGSVKTAEITIDAKTSTIQKLELIHEDESHLELHFSKIELGKPLDAKLFTFKAPPNTQRIQ